MQSKLKSLQKMKTKSHDFINKNRLKEEQEII